MPRSASDLPTWGGNKFPPSLAVDSQTSSAKLLEGAVWCAPAGVWEGSFYLVALVDAAVEPTVSKVDPTISRRGNERRGGQMGGTYTARPVRTGASLAILMD